MRMATQRPYPKSNGGLASYLLQLSRFRVSARVNAETLALSVQP